MHLFLCKPRIRTKCMILNTMTRHVDSGLMQIPLKLLDTNVWLWVYVHYLKRMYEDDDGDMARPDMVKIYIFSYLFHIISDIISQNGIFDMILYLLKIWDRRYDIISHFGRK